MEKIPALLMRAWMPRPERDHRSAKLRTEAKEATSSSWTCAT